LEWLTNSDRLPKVLCRNFDGSGLIFEGDETLQTERGLSAVCSVPYDAEQYGVAEFEVAALLRGNDGEGAVGRRVVTSVSVAVSAASHTCGQPPLSRQC